MADKLFDQGITIMDAAESGLASSLIKAEKDIYNEILKIFENVSITNGKLSSTEQTDAFLLSLDNRIALVLKKKGYNDAVIKYLTNFDKIAQNVKEIQGKLNKINLTSTQIEPFKRIEVSNTVDNLLGSGLNKTFVQPIRQGLYRSILFGSTITDVEKLVRGFVISKEGQDSTLLRYVKQVSRDSISQFDGGLQAKIASELDLNAMRYIGSIILDSRAQCMKWTQDALIKLDFIFEKEIEDAIAGKLYFEDKKSGGMIKGTNLSNILANRGGYNCRHRGIATKIF